MSEHYLKITLNDKVPAEFVDFVLDDLVKDISSPTFCEISNGANKELMIAVEKVERCDKH